MTVIPRISRRLSVLTATATITAIERKPLSRHWPERQCGAPDLAQLCVGGVEPEEGPVALEGPFRNACTRSSISPQSRETWLFDVPVSPMARTRSSTARVETPWM